MSQRLQIAVLVADDVPPDMRETIETSVKKALDKLLVGFGGELYIGDYAANSLPPGHIARTVSYAGPRKAKAS
jgi:hypothetical protein